jgi:hypothetical protein
VGPPLSLLPQSSRLRNYIHKPDQHQHRKDMHARTLAWFFSLAFALFCPLPPGGGTSIVFSKLVEGFTHKRVFAVDAAVLLYSGPGASRTSHVLEGLLFWVKDSCPFSPPAP